MWEVQYTNNRQEKSRQNSFQVPSKFYSTRKINSLVNFRAQKQFESILDILSTALPESVQVQEKLDSLITKKSSYIKKTYRSNGQQEKYQFLTKKTLKSSIYPFKVSKWKM